MKIKTNPQDIFDEKSQWESYMSKMGFYKKWKQFVDFIEGNQWPPSTDKTKDMPRPVINQCDFIIENKKSNILSQSLKMVFSPDEMSDNKELQEVLSQASQNYSDQAETTWHDLDQDMLNEDLVNSTLSIGTGIIHYFFDNSIKGGQFTKYVGAIRGEIIESLDIMLANPQLKASQTQKQHYISFIKREFVEDLVEQAKKTGSDWDKIACDDDVDDKKSNNDKKDIDNVKKATTITKYYKENGEVKWTKVTRDAVIQKPRTLRPDDIELDDGTIIKSKPFTLYPIEILVFKQRNKCTFGRSAIEDLIPSQKAINFFVAMMLLSTQQTAWPKIISKMGALVGQTITNEPGEMLVDHTQGADGIKYMQPPNFSNMPMVLTDKLVELNRLFTGTTEVATGEVMGANMAASAIVALQNQANKPVENQQHALFRSIKNCGRIYEEFYKTYYNQPRPLTTKKDLTLTTKQFTGTDSADMSFGLKVDVGPKSVFSESLQMNVLDSYAQRGWLNKFEHAKYTPDNILPSSLKHDFALQEEEMKNNPPSPQPDKPGISISFGDLPQDAQQQLLAQIGIKSQGGLSPTNQANIEVKQSEIQLKQHELLKDTLESHSNHNKNNMMAGENNEQNPM